MTTWYGLFGQQGTMAVTVPTDTHACILLQLLLLGHVAIDGDAKRPHAKDWALFTEPRHGTYCTQQGRMAGIVYITSVHPATMNIYNWNIEQRWMHPRGTSNG